MSDCQPCPRTLDPALFWDEIAMESSIAHSRIASMTRDNFPTPIKTALAKRAGFRCSYPGCQAVTIGPSDESDAATANTGEAAHINSASGGRRARRHDPLLSSEQRKSIENGIWCCNIHAELIDTDEITYTVELLKSWRQLAETKARIRQAFGDIELSRHPAVTAIGIAPESVIISSPEDNQRIGKAVQLACIKEVWGNEIAGALRDFLIEYSRNALTHGEATEVQIRFEPHCVRVIDNGTNYVDTTILGDPRRSRGGGMAYRNLLTTCMLNPISIEISDLENRLHIPLVSSAQQIPSVNPCAVFLSTPWGEHPATAIEIWKSCDRVYVITPDYSCYSDCGKYEKQLEQIIQHNPNVTIVLQDVTDAVYRHFQTTLSGIEVVVWQAIAR